MTPQGPQGVNVSTAPPPIVDLKRIERIQTYEVMEGDLADLERAIGDESQALGFWTFCAGVAIPAAISWKTAKDLSAAETAIYAVVTLGAVLATVWFVIAWVRKRKQRPSILSRIRQSPQQSPPALPPTT
jgi:hypothetical protein